MTDLIPGDLVIDSDVEQNAIEHGLIIAVHNKMTAVVIWHRSGLCMERQGWLQRVQRCECQHDHNRYVPNIV